MEKNFRRFDFFDGILFDKIKFTLEINKDFNKVQGRLDDVLNDDDSSSSEVFYDKLQKNFEAFDNEVDEKKSITPLFKTVQNVEKEQLLQSTTLPTKRWKKKSDAKAQGKISAE